MGWNFVACTVLCFCLCIMFSKSPCWDVSFEVVMLLEIYSLSNLFLYIYTNFRILLLIGDMILVLFMVPIMIAFTVCCSVVSS